MWIMKAIQKKFKSEHISTGLTSLDNLLGGGIALGKITEFAGSWSVGKSTLALQLAASAQKQKRACLYAETEFQFTPEYATNLGVDCEDLDFIQERLGEPMLDAVEEWANTNKDGLTLIDSIGGILPKEE